MSNEPFRALIEHLALSLEKSAKHLKLPADLKSLSDDRRLAVLQHFLKIMLPELGSDLLGKFALEILEKKLLRDELDGFAPETLNEFTGNILGHRSAPSKSVEDPASG